MSRSKWKGGFLAPALLKKTKKTNKIKRIWSRNSVISRNFLNQKVLVHGGKGFRFVSITEDKLGLKFGEFSFTRKKVKKNIIKKKKKSKLMSKGTNLATLRKFRNFNLSNNNSNFYLHGFNFLKNFKQLLQEKQVILCNENLNLFTHFISFKGDLFFKTVKIKSYRKRRVLKQIFYNQKIFFFKKIFDLTFRKMSKVFSVNVFLPSFKLLNKEVDSKMLVLLFKKLKPYSGTLFSRRFGLFIDFLKLSVLFACSKINAETYLSIITDVFKFLKKRSHAKFFSFLKAVFFLLSSPNVNKSVPYMDHLRGFKLLIKGRLKGKPMASSIIIKTGIMPTQTLNANVSFAKGRTFTQNFGVFGFKIWVFRNKS